jgi:hypothetical protein
MPQLEINRIVRSAERKNLGADGGFVAAVPGCPVACTTAVTVLVGAATATALGVGIVEVHNHSGLYDRPETLVDSSRTGHGSLAQLINARSVELTSQGSAGI